MEQLKWNAQDGATAQVCVEGLFSVPRTVVQRENERERRKREREGRRERKKERERKREEARW